MSWFGRVHALTKFKDAQCRDYRPLVSGFTLAEILCVIGVLLVLATILLPVYARSKEAAVHTSELNNLRQLGLAGQLYNQEFGDFPTSGQQLSHFNPKVKNLLVSSRDPYPNTIVQGLRTYVASMASPTTIESDYRASYLGLGDYSSVYPHPSWPESFNNLMMARYTEMKARGQNAGWLVSFMPQGPVVQSDIMDLSRGKLDRLTFEGAVLRRQNCRLGTETGMLNMLYMCFADLNDKDAMFLWNMTNTSS